MAIYSSNLPIRLIFDMVIFHSYVAVSQGIWAGENGLCQAMPFARDLGLIEDHQEWTPEEWPESRPGEIPIRRQCLRLRGPREGTW